MPLVWNKKLSISNAVLDSEHKSLLGIVNTIEEAINKYDYPTLLGAIKLLKEGIQAHFANEARFAEAINFDFGQHDLMHQHLLKELDHTMNQLEYKVALHDVMWCHYSMAYYSTFLHDWFVDHIVNSDMAMKPVLKSYPYDFRPALTSNSELLAAS